MLEIFEAAQHVQPTTRALSFIIQTKASDIRLGSMQRRKRCEGSDARKLWQTELL